MGLFDWVMNGIGFTADAEQQEEDFIPIEPKKKKKKKRLFGKKRFEVENELGSTQSTFDFDQFNALKEDGNTQENSYGGYSSSGFGGFGGTTSYNNKNFVFFNPTNYEEIKKLVEYLKQGEPAIVNFDRISENEAQRSLDFISGAACALGGKLQRITGNFFLVTPDGYNITKPAGQDL